MLTSFILCDWTNLRKQQTTDNSCSTCITNRQYQLHHMHYRSTTQLYHMRYRSTTQTSHVNSQEYKVLIHFTQPSGKQIIHQLPSLFRSFNTLNSNYYIIYYSSLSVSLSFLLWTSWCCLKPLFLSKVAKQRLQVKWFFTFKKCIKTCSWSPSIRFV